MSGVRARRSTQVAKLTLRATAQAQRWANWFFIGYSLLCLGVMRELSRSPVCPPQEERGCVPPRVRLRDEMDLVALTSLSREPWGEANVTFARYAWPASESLDVDASVAVPATTRLHGTTLYAHFYARPATGSRESSVDARTAAHLGSVELTTVRRVSRGNKRRLLSSETMVEQEGVAPHWKFGRSPVTLRVLNVGGSELLPPRTLYDGLNGARPRGWPYDPIAYVDELATLVSHFMPMSRNLSKAPPTLKFRYRVSTPLGFALRSLVAKQLLDMANDLAPPQVVEELRFRLSDEQVFRYALSQAIGVVHVYLDALAFREDLGFYVGRDDFKGVSASGLIWGLARSIILLLYLRDQDASWFVLWGLVLAAYSQFHKVMRVLEPRLMLKWPFVAVRPLDDPGERETADLDSVATSHLGLALGPLFLGFAIYQLNFALHKSWYSWVIGTLADLSYFFGFLMMTPQLYVNYKLQSVAHLPVKVFAYKLFNTFIDDAFAWLVKMPLKHRIMTLRDDLVFLVFLYQYWKYDTDKSRRNEFGFRYDNNAASDESDDAGNLATSASSSSPHVTASEGGTSQQAGQHCPDGTFD